MVLLPATVPASGLFTFFSTVLRNGCPFTDAPVPELPGGRFGGLGLLWPPSAMAWFLLDVFDSFFSMSLSSMVSSRCLRGFRSTSCDVEESERLDLNGIRCTRFDYLNVIVRTLTLVTLLKLVLSPVVGWNCWRLETVRRE